LSESLSDTVIKLTPQSPIIEKLDSQHDTLIKLLFKQLDKDKTGMIFKEDLLRLI